MMMKNYFDDLVSGIENRIASDPASKSPKKMYTLEIARLGSRLYSEDETMALCGVTAPFDLMNAMGVTACFFEFFGGMLATTGMAGEFLEEAENAGYAGDTCAYHRSVMGALGKGLLPEPDFLVATSAPCISGLAIIETIARHYKKDIYALNIPQELSTESVQYLAGQIKEMATFIEDRTGRKLDRDHLSQSVENTNKARALMLECYKQARAVPSPVHGRLFNNFGIAMALLLGTKESVNVVETYRDYLKDMTDRGESGVPGEKLRLLWFQNRIQFKNPVIDILETEYQAAVIADELNDITWAPIDPEDPFTGMAERSISIPLNGTIRKRIDHLKKMAEDYQIDGIINPCHWGCRQGTGSRGMITEGMKEIGIPVLNLEVDCVDPRNFSEGQIRTRLEAFIEMLNGNK